MIVAGHPPPSSHPVDCASPPNTSTEGSSSVNGMTSSGPPSSLSSMDLASILAASTQAAIKQGLFKQMVPITDPSTFLTLSQLFSNPPSSIPSTQATGKTVQTERKRPYPCSFQYCVLCQKDVHSSKLPCHIRQCHVAKPMFQCPACDFTSTYSKNNVKSHMVSLHGLAGDPISYMEQYASQVEEYMKICFPNVRGRGRPIHGRNSPVSPSPSTGRRNSQTSSMARRPSEQQQLMQAMAMQQARQAEQAAAQFYGLSPLLFTPPSMVLPPSLTLPHKSPLLNLASNNNILDYRPLLSLRPPIPKMESRESKGVSSTSSEGTESTLSMATEECTNTSTVSPSFPPRVQRTLVSKYIDHPSFLHALSSDDCTGTVFNSFPSSPINIVEKLDLSQFEGIVSSCSSLLNESQKRKICSLRSEEGFKLFEVLYALHRVDASVLSIDRLSRVAEIAPSEVDTRRIRLYEETNATLTEDEQLIVQLSKVDRLEEKLFVLLHMVHFKERTDELIQSLSSLTTSSRSLRSSSQLSLLLQLVLTLVNVINGDFNIDLVHGFRVSDLSQMASFTLPDGRPFLSLLTSVCRRSFPDMSSLLESLSSILSPLSNVSFPQIMSKLHSLQEGTMRVEREMRLSGVASDFVSTAQPTLLYLQEQVGIAMEQQHSLLHFLGEPRLPPCEVFEPNLIFTRLFSFVQSLLSELSEIDVVKSEYETEVPPHLTKDSSP